MAARIRPALSTIAIVTLVCLGILFWRQPTAESATLDQGFRLNYNYDLCIQSCDSQYGQCTARMNGTSDGILYCSNQHDTCRATCISDRVSLGSVNSDNASKTPSKSGNVDKESGEGKGPSQAKGSQQQARQRIGNTTGIGDKPAAQGYIPGQPSNYEQDKQLKELEQQDQPPPSPPPSPSPSPNPQTNQQQTDSQSINNTVPTAKATESKDQAGNDTQRIQLPLTFKGVSIGASEQIFVGKFSTAKCNPSTKNKKDRECKVAGITYADLPTRSIFASFQDNKMSSLSVLLDPKYFDELAGLLIDRFGTPDSDRPQPVQPGAGKTVENRTVRWRRDNTVLLAVKHIGDASVSAISFRLDASRGDRASSEAESKSNQEKDM